MSWRSREERTLAYGWKETLFFCSSTHLFLRGSPLDYASEIESTQCTVITQRDIDSDHPFTGRNFRFPEVTWMNDGYPDAILRHMGGWKALRYDAAAPTRRSRNRTGRERAKVRRGDVYMRDIESLTWELRDFLNKKLFARTYSDNRWGYGKRTGVWANNGRGKAEVMRTTLREPSVRRSICTIKSIAEAIWVRMAIKGKSSPDIIAMVSKRAMASRGVFECSVVSEPS